MVQDISRGTIGDDAWADNRADALSWGVPLHPDYDPLAGEAGTNDLALTEMNYGGLKSRYVKAVTLPKQSHVARVQSGLNVTVLGVDAGHLSQVQWPLLERENEQADWIMCAQMPGSQYVEAGDNSGPLLMRDGEARGLVGTSFYSHGAGGQPTAQRTSPYLPWIAGYVEGVTAPPPVAPPTAPTTSGVTVSLSNRTGSLCRSDDLFTTDGPVSAAAGGSVDFQIDGQRFRTVLLVDCGHPYDRDEPRRAC